MWTTSTIEDLQLLDLDYELSSLARVKGSLVAQQIPAVAKDVFVWIVGPRHHVTILIAPFRNHLTYLLKWNDFVIPSLS